MTAHLQSSRRSKFLGLTGQLCNPVTVAVLLAVHGQASMAQTTSGAAADSLEEIVVTAQKREERLQDVPISMTVLGGRDLDQQAVGGALEALSQVPGISQTTSGVGNATSITIRGVAPGSPFLDGSPTVGYYIDSIPFGLVKSAAIPNTDVYDMSRIEVLRGPQGTLYGASALNGVVRLLTNDADPTQFELKARAGTSATQGGATSFRVDAEVNVPIVQDKLAIRVVGGDERLGGWIDQPERGIEDANSSLSKYLRVKVDARPIDDLKIDLSAWSSRENDDAAPYADSAGNQYTPLPVPQETDYNAYNGKIVYDLPSVSISSATSYLNERRLSYVDYSYVTPTSQLYSRLPGELVAEELVLNSRGNGPWRWSVGGFYRNAHDDLYQTLPPVLAGPINWRDFSKSEAVFGQLTRTFDDDHFELTAGARYFHDNVGVRDLINESGGVDRATDFHAVTPRFVATWLPNAYLTAYASYSEGFRSGFEQSPLALLAAPGLPPVQADKLHNYELGAKGSLFDGFVTYDTAVYYIKWDGVQQSGDVLYNGVVIGASVNGTSASGIGTDVSVTLHPTRALQIGAGVSHNGLTEDHDVLSQGSVLYPKGSRLAYSAAYTANAFTDYAVALNGKLDAHLNMSANYHSAQTIREIAGAGSVSFESGAPLLVNGSIDIANHSNQTVSIYVQNLTNWNGLTLPAPDATDMFRDRPRTVGIEFEAKY